MINKSILLSIFIHIIVFGLLIFLQQTSHIILASRSDGMEVMLVTPEEITTKERVLPKAIVTPIDIQNKPAEVNIKQQDTVVTPVTPDATSTENKIEKPTQKAKAINTKNHLNDLLNDIEPVVNKHSGKATGGTTMGTSNTQNMISNYADLVVRTVRPFVLIPNDTAKGSIAVVKVTLLPNMHVYKVKLEKSSGNLDYDANVQQAIRNVAVFPPLPEGAKFADYRQLRLVFQPE